MRKPVKLVNTKAISHEEWVELRKRSIGGSDAGTIMGMNPYSSLVTLYADKMGLSKPRGDNEAMRQGRDLEAYVAERYMEITGNKVQNDNFMYHHPDYPFITANIDRRIVGQNAGLECKTMSAFNGYDLEGNVIPPSYFCQCQHYMEVMGFDFMDLCILVFQKPPYIFHIERNEEFIEQMLQAEIDFWKNYIENGEMPAVDGSEPSLETLKEIYPMAVPESSIAISGLDMMVEDYKMLGEMAKDYEDRKKALQGKICAMLGDNEEGTGDVYGVTWKNQEKRSVDAKKLKEKYPAIYDECSNLNSFRTFRTKKLKKKAEKEK